MEKSLLFEVSCMDLTHISVTYEMSADEGMASLEFDLSDRTGIQCFLHRMATSGSTKKEAGQNSIAPEDLARKVLQKYEKRYKLF